jgi:hypothetical protein
LARREVEAEYDKAFIARMRRGDQRAPDFFVADQCKRLVHEFDGEGRQWPLDESVLAWQHLKLGG